MKDKSKRIFTKIETMEGLSSVEEIPLTEDKKGAEESPPSKTSSVEADKNQPLVRVFKRKVFQKMDETTFNENSKQNNSVDKGLELPPSISPPEPVDIKKSIIVSKSEPTTSGETYGNFTIKILKRIRKIKKDGHVEIFYNVQVLTNTGECYRGRVSGSQLDSLNWIKEISGGAAYFSIVKNARTLVLEILHSLIDNKNYDEIVEFEENGWKKIDCRWYYVTDFGLIGDSQNIYYGDYSRSFIYDKNIVRSKNTFEATLRMTDICHDRSITLPLLLFTHMGILCKPYELAEVPIKGVMALIGTTNSRKTSLALCMTRIFNRDNLKTADISFESTLGGLETESSKYADSVFLIDDIHPTTSKKNHQKMMDALEFILRRYGDRIPKRRMTDFMINKSAGTYDVSGVCLLTGEDIGGVQSSMTRVLILEVDKFSVNNEILGFYQENPYILTSHLYDFITYVTYNFEQIVSFIKNRVLEWRKAKKYPISRYSEYFAQLMTCAEILAFYALERRFWNYQEAENWKTWCGETLDKLIKKNLLSTEREDFAIMIIQALQVAIDEHGVHALENFKKQSVQYKTILEDENYYFVKKEYLIELTNSFWTRLGKSLPFSTPNQLAIFLEQKDLIMVREESDGKRRSLTLPGRKQRFLYIKKSKMRELLEKVEI